MDLFTLFALGSLALMALIAIELGLAIRHDQVVRNAGPQQQHAALVAQVDAKRQELVDIDEKLAARTEALRDFAERQAEVDALMRQRDELLNEYQMLDERRQEIRDLDRETEAAITKHAEAARVLLEKEEALSAIERKVARAEALIKEVDQLEDNKKMLTAEVESLRQETSDLRRLEADAETVRATTEELRREMARLEGSAEHLEERRSAALVAAEAAEADLETKRVAQSENIAAAASVAESLRQLEEQRAPLEARLAYLKHEVERTTGHSEAEDGLAVLREPPVFLSYLRTLSERAKESEAKALQRVEERMQRLGLTYPSRTLRAFHTAMKVNETTQLTVLAGISGTGKSQLPRQWAAAMGLGFLQVPVQPRWDSSQDLMGFYNYIESRFRPTEMARALYHLDQFNGPSASQDLSGRMLLILLDEMNLARVEYYFSDFLSRL